MKQIKSIRATESVSMMEIGRAIQRVAGEIALARGVTLEEIVVGRTRRAHIVSARHECMWKARQVTHASYPILGWYFQRDHTTCIYAVKKYDQLMGTSVG